jgi:hypothetical protein
VRRQSEVCRSGVRYLKCKEFYEKSQKINVGLAKIINPDNPIFNFLPMAIGTSIFNEQSSITNGRHHHPYK